MLKREGDCSLRHAPCSTFKIPISLMGFDQEILLDETHPELPFKEEYSAWLETWKQSFHPSLWFKYSCVWFSWYVTEKLGMSKFKDYIEKFNYGNKDLSGDKGRNNGLTNAWLSSSLEVSPEEQIEFLKKLLNDQLPVSPKAHQMTKNILFLEELIDGWKLYGKTGSGSPLSKDRMTKLQDKKTGWYVGWLENEDRKIVFTNYIEFETKEKIFGGPRSKKITKEKLLQIVTNSQSEMTNEL